MSFPVPSQLSPPLGKPSVQHTLWGASAAALIAVAGWVVVRAEVQSGPPARCPPGWASLGSRCCPPGQRLEKERCVGSPSACPNGLERLAQSCVAIPRRVRIGPGTLKVGPGDWEAQGVVRPSVITIDRPFWIDAYEVTIDRWGACAASGRCAWLDDDEPGRPVRRVTLEQAAAFCAWAGGAIPTQQQWLFAAASPSARRYPWGDTGAVCRRGAWGLAAGPCASGAMGPEIAGVYGDGASPEGVFDLAGNVAEWVIQDGGSGAVCGGSWRTALATGLRTWRTEERAPQKRWDDVGLRCRYASADPP